MVVHADEPDGDHDGRHAAHRELDPFELAEALTTASTATPPICTCAVPQMVAFPKMMANMDPEQLKEMQQMQVRSRPATLVSSATPPYRVAASVHRFVPYRIMAVGRVGRACRHAQP